MTLRNLIIRELIEAGILDLRHKKLVIHSTRNNGDYEHYVEECSGNMNIWANYRNSIENTKKLNEMVMENEGIEEMRSITKFAYAAIFGKKIYGTPTTDFEKLR